VGNFENSGNHAKRGKFTKILEILKVQENFEKLVHF
jgi:hypothetical protein